MKSSTVNKYIYSHRCKEVGKYLFNSYALAEKEIYLYARPPKENLFKLSYDIRGYRYEKFIQKYILSTIITQHKVQNQTQCQQEIRCVNNHRKWNIHGDIQNRTQKLIDGVDFNNDYKYVNRTSICNFINSAEETDSSKQIQRIYTY